MEFVDQIGDEDRKQSNHVQITDNASPMWIPGYQKQNYLSTYPWLETYRSSVPPSVAESVKSSRSRKSQKVSAKVKWCRLILLLLLISAGCFLIFYPLIMHYIVDGAHVNDTFNPYAQENCTQHPKKP